MAKNIPEVVSSTAFAVVLVVVFVNVILRYFLKVSFIWSEEIAAIGFIYVIFIGAAACYKRKMHIGIDVVVSLLPSLVRRNVQIVVSAFLVIFNAYLMYLSTKFSLSAWVKITLALRIPYTYLDIASTIGFGFMTYYAAKDLVSTVREYGSAAVSE